MAIMPGSAKTVLFIRHDPDAHPGYVGARFAERGFQLRETAITLDYENTNPTNIDFGDPSDYDVIVPLGAIFGVNDTDKIGNWIGDELKFLAEAHSQEIPILGICFGGQALAAALGGSVEKAPTPEIGWHTIETDKPDLLAEGPWMQWHYDRFSVPPGASEVARSNAGPQAFTIGRSLGLQFHPEVSADIVRGWLDGAPAEELAKPQVNIDRIRAETSTFAPQAKHRTEQLVDWFLDDLAADGQETTN